MQNFICTLKRGPEKWLFEKEERHTEKNLGDDNYQ